MTTYDTTFYDTIRAGCQSSAAVVAPIVYGIVKPQTVVDVGGGEGHWAQAFHDLGCEAWVIDNDGVESPGRAPDVPFVKHDLGRGRLDWQHPAIDLVICLEVAEHLPESRATSFVSDLCAFKSEAILFSAAIPSQTGTGHINCQWQSYWAEKFAWQGYCNAVLDPRWDIWDDQRVEPWYRQNIVLFTRSLLNEQVGPMDVVHPDIWKWFH